MRTTSRLRVALAATFVSTSFLLTTAATPPLAAAATPTSAQPASPATTATPTDTTPTAAAPVTATPPSGASPAGTSPSASSTSGTSAPSTAPVSPGGSAAPRAAPDTTPHPATTTLADLVIADALRHVGAPYQWGSAGPWTFDCSGLVYRVFADNGIAGMIDDSHSAYEQYAIFRARGLASRTGGEPGDLVVYGGGSHIGIYLGHDRVVSALVEGVRVTGIYALTTPFTAFLHTHLDTRTVTLASTSKRARRSATARRAAADRSTRKPRAILRHTVTAAILRAAPTTTARSLAVLAPGTSLRVLRSTRDRAGRTWDEVRTPAGRLGWVANWLLRA